MIRIQGYSDDIVHIEADGVADEFDDCAQQTVRSFLIGTKEAGLVARAVYAPKRKPKDGIGDGGTWQLQVDLVDEDVPIPWTVRVEADGYTPVLVVECPNGTPWKCIAGGEDE